MSHSWKVPESTLQPTRQLFAYFHQSPESSRWTDGFPPQWPRRCIDLTVVKHSETHSFHLMHTAILYRTSIPTWRKIKPRAGNSLAKTQITHLQHKLKSHAGFMTVNINTRRRASPGFREGAHIIAIYLGGLFCIAFKVLWQKRWDLARYHHTDEKQKVKA